MTADQKDALHINRIDADTKVKEELEAKRQEIAARTAVPTFSGYSVDDLIAAFGEDEVRAVNDGELPETAVGIEHCAAALGLL